MALGGKEESNTIFFFSAEKRLMGVLSSVFLLLFHRGNTFQTG